jgi:hypothetical protein
MRLALSLALAILVLAPSYAAAGEPTYQVGDQFQVGVGRYEDWPLPPVEYDRPSQLPSQLPPVEYDRPYQGQLTIARGDARTMQAICPKTTFPVTLGCAIRYREANICHIYIADDEILKAAGWSYEIVLRHEEGHCNGWPADHRGGRPSVAQREIPEWLRHQEKAWLGERRQAPDLEVEYWRKRDAQAEQRYRDLHPTGPWLSR